MRRLSSIALLLLLACDEGRTVPPPGGKASPSDGGVRGDASPGADAAIVAPPMGLVLAIGALSWGPLDGSRATLYAAIGLANGTGAPPAPLSPTAFTLETRGGALIGAAPSSAIPGACVGDTSVAAGAQLGCFLELYVPLGDAPKALHYLAGERTADASFDACDAQHPGGLCELERQCRNGVCDPRCGAIFCVGAETCVAEECRPPCSSEHPDGFCEAGACRGGQCDPSCRRFDITPECASCLGSANCSPLPNSCSADDCGSCVANADVCTCEAGACAGCPEIHNLVDCVAAACPNCVR